MMVVRGRGLIMVALLTACVPAQMPEPAPPAPERMPELRVQQRAGAEAPEPPVHVRMELPSQGQRVTLTATDADLRSVLPLLAEAAGVSLVVGPEVQGTVSVHFEDVPAIQAILETLRQAGLMIVVPLRPPTGPTVFYTVPVNVNEAGVEQIQTHFGVSADLARFVVQARLPRSR